MNNNPLQLNKQKLITREKSLKAIGIISKLLSVYFNKQLILFISHIY